MRFPAGVRSPRLAGALLLASLSAALAGCASRTVPIPIASIDEAVREEKERALLRKGLAAYESARNSAYQARRLKALFVAELSPVVGASRRGYLSIWWDGSVLVWRASAPLAGAVRGGRLVRGRAQALPDDGSPFSGLTSEDLLATLLGAPDLPAAAVSWDPRRRVSRIGLAGGDRTARIDEAGHLVGLELPNSIEVRFDTKGGAGESAGNLPGEIFARTRSGDARLLLQQLAPWPEDEPVPEES